MPSLEIICINQAEPSDFSYLPFAIEAETGLVSQHSPQPLFRADFDQLEGCIYYLLRDQKDDTPYHLLRNDWFDRTGKGNESQHTIQFREEFVSLVKDMTEQLMLSSPCGEIVFLTDYQIGLECIERHGPLTFSDFWQLHDEGAIRINAAYFIVADGTV